MNNRLPQVAFIFDRYKKASPSKKASVELRISYNYRQKWMSTGIMLYPSQWRNSMVVNCPDAIQMNQALNDLLVEVNQVILEMKQKGAINIMSISNEIEKKRTGNISFIDFCYKKAKVRKYGKSASRQRRYNYFLTFFNDWGVIKEFSDITEDNIILFDTYLKERSLTTYTKWHNYHMFLNSFITDAIKSGYVTRNPYEWINIDKSKESNGLDRCLTPKQLQKIIKCKMPTESLDKVRDLFIFQTYTCLRYSDLAVFDASFIQEINGMKVYIRNSIKTKKPFTVPMQEPALKILHKYNNHLPIISNVKYNLYLKAAAQAAGLDIKLTSHWARHTGATLLINEGLDTKFISRICGHSSTRVTEQIYAKLLDKTLVEAVKNIKKNSPIFTDRGETK